MLLAVELRYVFARTLRASRSGHRFGNQEAAKAPDVGGTCKTAAVEETVLTRLTTCRPCDTFFRRSSGSASTLWTAGSDHVANRSIPNTTDVLRTGPGQGRHNGPPVAPVLGVLAVFPRWPGEAADDDQGPAVAPATMRSWTGRRRTVRCGSVRNGGPVWYRGPVVRASSRSPLTSGSGCLLPVSGVLRPDPVPWHHRSRRKADPDGRVLDHQRRR
jgi:hypothetical protein